MSDFEYQMKNRGPSPASTSRASITLDRYTRVILTVLTVFCGVIAVELWERQPTALPAAEAQVPDTALQRKQLIEEARHTNDLLERIATRLEKGTIKVRMQAGADREKGERGP